MVSAALVEIVEAAVTAQTVVVDAVAEDELADPIVDPAAQVAAATVAVVDQVWNSVNQTAHSDSRHYY